MNEKCKIGFVYTLELLGPDGRLISSEKVHNLMPTVAVNYLLSTAFSAGSAYSTWYLSLFKANHTPAASDDMTALIAACDESTGYTTTGTNRQTLVLPAVDAGSISTLADPNIFAFPTGETIRGAFITSGITRGSNTGLLVSEVLFPSPYVIPAGSYLRVPVGLVLVSV